MSNSSAGKGSRPRKMDFIKFGENYNKIFRGTGNGKKK
jgi:hypothetical protein